MKIRRHAMIYGASLALACAALLNLSHAEQPYGTVHCGFGPGTLTEILEFGPGGRFETAGQAIRHCIARGGTVNSVNLFSPK